MNSAAGGPNRASLATLGVAAFLSVGSMRICDPLIPAFSEAFTITTGSAARTISSFAIAYGFMQLVFGYLGDRYGKFPVIACAATATTAGNLLAALSGSFETLVAARVVSGATAAGIIPLTLAWIGDSVPYERRQEVLAKILTATVLGSSLGQFISGFIADTLGWRWVFALLTVLFLLVGVQLLRMRATQAAVHPVRSPGGYTGQLASVFATPWARWILLVTLLEGAFAFSALAFLPAHLHATFGFSLKAAAAVVALFGVGGLLYSLQAGVLVDRLGERGLARVGGACIASGYAAIALSPAWYWAIPACLVSGLGFNMLHNTLQTHATQMAPAVRGTAVSLFATCLFIGQSLGVYAASVAVDRVGFRPIFLTCAVIIGLLAAAFAYSLRRRLADTGGVGNRVDPGVP